MHTLHTLTHIHTHRHTHTQTHIHTHTHTYAYMYNLFDKLLLIFFLIFCSEIKIVFCRIELDAQTCQFN